MSGEIDAREMLRQFDGAWNAHDEGRILGAFAEDGVVELHPGFPAMPSRYEGKAQLRQFVAGLLPGFHVESHGAEASGNVVSWKSAVSCDAFRQMGINTLECDSRATLNPQGQVQRFDVSFPPDLVRQAAGAQRDPR